MLKEAQITTPRWTHEWAAPRAPPPAVRVVNGGTGARVPRHSRSVVENRADTRAHVSFSNLTYQNLKSRVFVLFPVN